MTIEDPNEPTAADESLIDDTMMTHEQITSLRTWRVYGVPGTGKAPVMVRAHRLSVTTTGVLMFFTLRGSGVAEGEYLGEGYKEYTNWKEDVADAPVRVH